MKKRLRCGFIFIMLFFYSSLVYAALQPNDATLRDRIKTIEFSDKSFALSTWLKRENPQNQYGPILGIYEADGRWFDNIGVAVYWYGLKRLRVRVPMGDGTTIDKIINNVLSGSWCHVAVVYNGSQIDILINGNLKESISTTTPILIPPDDNYYIKFFPTNSSEKWSIGETALWLGDSIPKTEEIQQYFRGEGHLPSGSSKYYAFDTDYSPLELVNGRPEIIDERFSASYSIQVADAKITSSGLLLVYFADSQGNLFGNNKLDKSLYKGNAVLYINDNPAGVLKHYGVFEGNPAIFSIPERFRLQKGDNISLDLPYGVVRHSNGDKSGPVEKFYVDNGFGIDTLPQESDLPVDRVPAALGWIGYDSYWDNHINWVDMTASLSWNFYGDLDFEKETTFRNGLPVNIGNRPYLRAIVTQALGRTDDLHIRYNSEAKVDIANTEPVSSVVGVDGMTHDIYEDIDGIVSLTVRAKRNGNTDLNYLDVVYDRHWERFNSDSEDRDLSSTIIERVKGVFPYLRSMATYQVNNWNVVTPNHLTSAENESSSGKKLLIRKNIRSIAPWSDTRSDIQCGMKITTTGPHGLYPGQSFTIKGSNAVLRRSAGDVSVDSTWGLSVRKVISDTEFVTAAKQGCTPDAVVIGGGGGEIQMRIRSGPSPEKVCYAANHLGAEIIQLHVGHAFTDETIAAFLTRFRDGLNPDIRILLAYSNEVWNYAGPFLGQFQYTGFKGAELGMTKDEYYGYKSAKVQKIANDIFDQDVTMVLENQFVGPHRTDAIVQAFKGAGGGSFAISSAFYFAPALITPVGGTPETAFVESLNPGKVIDLMKIYIDIHGIPTFKKWEKLKRKYGVELFMYEGGFGLYGSNPISIRAKKIVRDAVYSPRMANVYYYAWVKAQEAGYDNVMLHSFQHKHQILDDSFKMNSIYWDPFQAAGLGRGESPSAYAHVVWSGKPDQPTNILKSER